MIIGIFYGKKLASVKATTLFLENSYALLHFGQSSNQKVYSPLWNSADLNLTSNDYVHNHLLHS